MHSLNKPSRSAVRFFFFQAEDGIRDYKVTGVQTCALPIYADADGHHITTLLLAFFFRHMTELIRKGHVYIAQPPLYCIKVGKETQWARDDAHKDRKSVVVGKECRSGWSQER